MQAHATDPGVFIRSMATRGHLGGMALAAPEAVRVLDASGKDVVLVETVGVGQAEVEVATATDTTVVVVAPGWGDAIQAAKAGILEIADVFVVNKADREGAAEATRDLKQMLHLGAARDWNPPVVATSTVDGSGVDDLYEAIERHRRHQEGSGQLDERRRQRVIEEVESMVAFRLRERVAGMLAAAGDATDPLVVDLSERRLDPYRAAEILVERMSVPK
jgi:LAO/AO transport system kinase